MEIANINSQTNLQIKEYLESICGIKSSDILFKPLSLRPLMGLYVNQEDLDSELADELDKTIRYLCFRVGLIFEHYGYFDEEDIPDLFLYGDYGYVYEMMLKCMYAARKKYLDVMLRDLDENRELHTADERYYVKLSRFNRELIKSDITESFTNCIETNAEQPYVTMTKGYRHWKVEFPNFCPSVEYTKYTKAAYQEVADILSIAFTCKATVEILEH